MAVGITLAAWALAFACVSLHLLVDPQRVVIRWNEEITADERMATERELTLTDGEQGGSTGTWNYIIRDRSSSNLERVVRHTRVRDTAHIDRSRFRIRLDRPDLPRWVVALIETDRVPTLAAVLALVALVGTWTCRRPLLRWGRPIGSRSLALLRRHTAHTSRLVLAWLSTTAIAVRAERRRWRSEDAYIASSPQPERVRGIEYLVGIATGLLFLVPLLAYGPFEEEEATLGIFASQVHYRALLGGEWLWWLNDFGFGTPLPIGTRLDFHPVFALSAVASLRLALSAVWIAHIAAMAVYFLRVAALTGLRRPLRLFLLVCCVFSVTSVCYFYENDWITHVIGWTLYPALVFYLHAAVTGGAERRFWFTAARLGVLFAFWLLNSHPGYLVPVFLPLVVYALVAATPRRSTYLCLLLAAALCLTICSERVYFFASEMRLFPTSLPRTHAPGLSVTDHVMAALSPLVPPLPHMRQPFIGFVAGLAALVSLLCLRRVRDAHARACSIAFVASLLLSLIPSPIFLAMLWNAPAGTWNLRDPMVFFGLLAGGTVLQRLMASPELTIRAGAVALVAVQAVQQGATVLVGYREFESHRGVLEFYRHQGHPTGIGQVLLDDAQRFGKRIYLSERAQFLVRGTLSRYGVHFGTDLVFIGLNPINGWFKSVSMDRLAPSWGLMHGMIRGERDVIENTALQDVLGINLVLTTAIEGPLPPGLVPLRRMDVQSSRGEYQLLLAANPRAWPTAVLLEPSAADVVLPRRQACSHAAALCRDYSELMTLRAGDVVDVASRNGFYRVRLPAADSERVLFLSTFYRPEWEARSARGALPVVPVADAFLGIRIPPGVDEVEVGFRPKARIALAWLGHVTMLILIAAVATGHWRGRRTEVAPSTAWTSKRTGSGRP